MSKEEQIDIAFLLGAGVEVGYGLSGGADFAITVIGDNTGQMDGAIGQYYNRDLNKWYPKYQHYNFQLEKLFEAALKKKLMMENNQLEYKSSFDNLIKEMVGSKKDQEHEIINKYTSYMGILDEKFHTLISPKYLGPNKFWGVVDCYTRAYLLLTGEMFKKTESRELTEKDYLDMLENPLEYYKRWKEVVSHNESYYEIIQKNIFNKENVAIVTTNYTPLCDNITKVKNIAHVNGRLNLFESPYKLCVYDVLKGEMPESDDIAFPYIFIQSGVKPIVEERQITEYSKMIKYFKNAQTIVVVGYRINADDNHINSFLRSAICNGKKVIYFNYNKELTDENIYSKLRIHNSEYHIDIINVSDNNCISEFKNIIYEYELKVKNAH